MTNEKATDVLRDIAIEMDCFCNGAKHWSDKDKEELEALDMAIKALKEQPKEDAIDYQRHIEDLEHNMRYEPTYNPEDGSM